MGLTRKLKRPAPGKGRTLEYGMAAPLSHAATQPAPPGESAPPLVVPPSAPVPASTAVGEPRRRTPPPEQTTGVRGRYATPVDELLVDRVGPIPPSKPPVRKSGGAPKTTVRGVSEEASGSRAPKATLRQSSNRSAEEVATSTAHRLIGRTPRRAKNGPDVAGAPIDSREAYLLAQIDGKLTIDDLADLTGSTVEEVKKCVERLSRLGLVLMS